MTISIDYDGTYTRDPKMWDDFIKLARHCGHQVVCITNRAFFPPCDASPPCVMICAGDNPKADYARDKGLHVDIWIDDMPGTIGPNLLLP